MGIKGVNVFMALEDFDLTIGIVVDYMHCILLGVTKTMMELWFLPKNNKKNCFIGLQVVKNYFIIINKFCSINIFCRTGNC